MFRNLRYGFYVTMGSLYSFAVYKDELIFQNKEFEKIGLNFHTSFGKRSKYLTHINLMIQFSYFTLSFLNMSLKIQSIGPILNKLLTKIYVSLAFPIGFIVTLVFWSLYAFDRDLIYPKINETVVPRYQNHLVHTLPLFGVLLDSFFTKHSYPKSFIRGAFPTILFIIGYIIWVFIIAHFSGIWVYPILENFSNIKRVIFIGSISLLVLFLYQAGYLINQYFWKHKNL